MTDDHATPPAFVRRVRPLAAALLVALAACSPDGDGRSAAERGAAEVVSDSRGTAQNPTGGRNAPRWHDAGAVVLVSLDGFGADYLARFAPPTLGALAAQGVHAARLVPPFPTKTFPSHYTLATGRHVDGHGLAGNLFHDPERGETYSTRDRDAVEDGSWYGAEPLWVTAERQGMVAASYFFVGSEADVDGVRPSYWHPFDNGVSGETRVATVLEWLAMPPETRPRMITLYFSDVDSAGHRHGPESDEVAAAVAKVDRHLATLVAGIEALPHGESVSVVVVSDHGMAAAPAERAHGVDVAGFEDVHWVASGPYATFLVDSDDPARHAAVRDAVAAQLPERIAVHQRTALPERLHYGAHRRSGDIVVVPPIGETVIDAADLPARDTFTHGWDPAFEAMHGLFVARGPAIVPGTRLREVHSVDVYGLVTHLLGLTPAPNDGEAARLAPALSAPARSAERASGS